MTTQNWPQLKTISPAYQLIKERGLAKHLEELQAYGLTVIPPEKIGDPTILERARAAILKLTEDRTGVKHDIDTGEHGEFDVAGSNDSQYLIYSFFESDRVFEEIIQHKMTLPLVEYFIGTACQLSSLTCFVKWQNPHGYGEGLGLHDDTGTYDGPLPGVVPHTFNTNWILTDYTKDNGAFCIVPGSHKLCRHPKPGEGVEDAVPIEAEAGSVLVFHGNVWHGAFPRINPGLRLSVNAYYCGRHFRVQEDFHGRISKEMLARNNARFRQLVNYDDPWGWTDKRGPIPYCLRDRWESLSKSERQAARDELYKSIAVKIK